MKLATTPHQQVQHLIHSSLEGSNTAKFPVKGQGTVSVQPSIFKAFAIELKSDNSNSIRLEIEASGIRLLYNGTEIAKKAGIGLNPSGEIQPYWLSLDTNNKRIRYGKGEMLRTLMLFEYSWAQASDKQLNTAEINNIDVQNTEVTKLQLLSIPVNLDPSPHIVSMDAVTLELLADNKISVISDLPEACQHLYSNVAGEGMSLRPADFPDFPEAIQHSILTPDCICYKKLAEKPTEFGYLRVTIDTNLGDSPGQPYVLEIWPAGNGSPIHDHGDACAVIKVLYGQIQVSWFAALSPKILTPWGKVIVQTEEVTFLTPDYYQIHQLFNPKPKGDQFCATIQSYRYEADNTQHYEYFDYIEDGKIKQFDPDSDWTYLDFKAQIHEEWLARWQEGPAGEQSRNFDDKPAANAKLTQLYIRSGKIIDAIQAVYGTQTMPQHGGNGGELTTITFTDDEYITEVSGQYGQYKFGNVTCITQLKIRTNKRLLPVMGNAEFISNLKPFNFTVPPQNEIIGFFGHSSEYINGLGIRFRPR
ncbi:jacalin-like lectin [Janthinobacterium sp. B9-8]|uniref:jacalin-like lectin n=1 Tax=Janthinobacterium sp. B9-8 TaxID=1236179 RepID=UPI0009EBFBBF|nr:jacalin-like lectin [Janthinobacterium sp. B9-8]